MVIRGVWLTASEVHVPHVQTVQKTVEVPQVQYEDQVVHVPVQKHVHVPMVQTVQKSVEVPQVEPLVRSDRTSFGAHTWHLFAPK